MQIVIEIPEDSYKATCYGCMLLSDVENVVQGIKNGTPLPKGHGDLIDRDMCLGMKAYDLIGEYGITVIAVPTEDIVRMEAVIPADKEGD